MGVEYVELLKAVGPFSLLLYGDAGPEKLHWQWMLFGTTWRAGREFKGCGCRLGEKGIRPWEYQRR